ncbi:hypothetical protein H2201_002376 [Coniosporium apollinis]|uniref:WSC domain-containing protein n=1 Tax=Coniosporium apollinis TaxID=61459 RepID=A0ABQ9P540_9PEZI|nr:hypothetical protein H2201_002376 [Coniosporium apollinis]
MNPAVVDSPQFGLLWKKPMNKDEKFYAKVLVYTPPSTGTQILFTASSQNWIRTFNAKTGEQLLTRQVARPFLQSDIGCTDIPDTIGIIGTPTIDPNTDIAYFYAKSYIPNYRTAGQNGVYNGVYYFYAVDVKTLQDVPGYPILVDGSVADNDKRMYFVGGVILQRPSLIQVGNVVYTGFGGHCDKYNYTGTVLGVDVVQKKVVANWVTEAGDKVPFSGKWDGEGGGGGIWQGGTSLSSDGPRLFLVTGNGGGHQNQGTPATGGSGCSTLGQAVINLRIEADGKLTSQDYFQPYDYQNMDGGDQDFGSSGVCMLDPTVFKGTSVSRIGVTSGKNGKIYIVNLDKLGGYRQGNGNTDGVLQTIITNKAVFGGSGSYPLEGGYFYSAPTGNPVYVYKLGFDGAGIPVFSEVGRSIESSAGRVGIGVPTVTSFQGKAGTGILWLTDPDAGLRAWYAVPGPDGKLKSIKMPQVSGINKFQRPAFGDTRLYVTDSNGNLYCIGSPVNLPLNCTGIDFGDVALGSDARGVVTCKALIPITKVTGMTVGDARFEVDNASLPPGALAAGATFEIPVRWNLTTANVQNTPGASFGSVTPGIKTTPLTITTQNGIAGYADSLPVSLSGNQVSNKAYVSLTPVTVDFGGVVVGASEEQPSSSLPFSIANLGLQPMTITRYAYTTDELDEPDVDFTEVTNTNGVWDLGYGFTSLNLLEPGTVIEAGKSVTVQAKFTAVNGTGDYLSYFHVYTDGGEAFTILEGSASTAPKANFSISTSEGGWKDELTLDFGPVAPGGEAQGQIRICNNGGSVLSVTKSKPPLGVIRALSAGIDFHEGQKIAVGDCAYGTVLFNPLNEPPNIPDFVVSDTWTLNVDDLDFGVHDVVIKGTVHDRIVGPTNPDGSARYQYLGCYQDQPRLLPKAIYPAGQQENGRCQNACMAAGYVFAGTEYHTECWCGNTPPPGSRFYPESEKRCTFSCSSDSSQACGGDGGFISVYYDTTKYTITNETYTDKPGEVSGGPYTRQSIGNYNHIGCYTEASQGRALSGKAVGAPATGGSVAFCESSCKGYNYFGVEYSNECFCGNTINGGSVLSPGATPAITGCDNICGGNSSEYCGGGGRLNMYQLNTVSVSSSAVASSSAPVSPTDSVIASPTASPTASATPTGPAVVESVGAFSHIGCYNEIGGRALTAKSFATDLMTVESCATFCETYTYFGVEYGRECYCGNTIPATSTAQDPTTCKMLCKGNSLQYCGGSSRLNMYEKKAAAASSSVVASSSAVVESSSSAVVGPSSSAVMASSSSAVVESSSSAVVASSSSAVEVPSSSAVVVPSSSAVVAPSSSAVVASSSAAPPAATTPAVVQSVGEYTHIGCYNEVSGRTLNAKRSANDLMTVENCATFCSAYTYFGVEYGRECYCGNSIPVTSTVQLSGCTKLCAGNALQYCGGSSKLNVYQKGGASSASSSAAASVAPSSSAAPVSSAAASSVAPPAGTSSTTVASPAAKPMVSGYTYQGCYTDNVPVTGRVLTGARLNGNTANPMTLEKCAAFCSKFVYWGTQYGQECFCGDVLGSGSEKVAETQCKTKCPGDPTELCGAGSRLTLYKLVTMSSSSVAVASEPAPAAQRVESASASAASESTVPSSAAAVSSSAAAESNVASSAAAASSTVAAETAAPASSSSTAAASSASPTEAPSSPSQAPSSPIAGQKLGDWAYLGCANSTNKPFPLVGASFTSNNMTNQECQSFCSGSKYNYGLAGTSGSTCYCGNALQSYSIVGFSGCEEQCAGDKSTFCGGQARLSVWNATFDIPPTTVKAVGAYAFEGCYGGDSGVELVSEHSFSNTTDMTVEMCVTRCQEQDLQYAALKGSTECFCASNMALNATPGETSSCNNVMVGNRREFGGGASFYGIYKSDSTKVDSDGFPKSHNEENRATTRPETTSRRRGRAFVG